VREVAAAYKAGGSRQTQVALLEVLGQSSSEEALPVLRASLRDPQPDIARGAVLALSEWATPVPMEDLLSLAKQPPSPALQVLALRGYLKLIALPSARTTVESARLLGEAMPLAKQAAERRTILSLLSVYACKEALDVAEAATKDPEVAKEAAAAVARINGLLKFQ
jgi:hypothetical protein